MGHIVHNLFIINVIWSKSVAFPWTNPVEPNCLKRPLTPSFRRADSNGEVTTNGGVAASSGAHAAGTTTEGNLSPPNSETGMRRMVVNDREIREDG